MALNLNTPIFDCPNELSIEKPKPAAELQFSFKPGYTVVSATPEYFPYGQTTRATIQISYYVDLSFECIIDIKTAADTEAPKLTCPEDIKQ